MRSSAFAAFPVTSPIRFIFGESHRSAAPEAHETPRPSTASTGVGRRGAFLSRPAVSATRPTHLHPTSTALMLAFQLPLD